MARISGKKATAALAFCIKRDGPHCVVCRKKIARELHHKDGNYENNPANGKNWEGRCSPCHRLSHPRGPSKRGVRMRHIIALIGSERKSELERIREEANDSTKVLTPEMARNTICEPKFREWLEGIIIEVKVIAEKDVVDGGAEYAGCSQQATKRYLDKLCSFTGVYERFSNEEGRRFIRVKQPPEKRSSAPAPVPDA